MPPHSSCSSLPTRMGNHEHQGGLNALWITHFFPLFCLTSVQVSPPESQEGIIFADYVFSPTLLSTHDPNFARLVLLCPASQWCRARCRRPAGAPLHGSGDMGRGRAEPAALSLGPLLGISLMNQFSTGHADVGGRASGGGPWVIILLKSVLISYFPFSGLIRLRMQLW